MAVQRRLARAVHAPTGILPASGTAADMDDFQMHAVRPRGQQIIRQQQRRGNIQRDGTDDFRRPLPSEQRIGRGRPRIVDQQQFVRIADKVRQEAV